MNADEIRKDFPIFQERPQLVYLDNAATSQKPEKVLQAINNFYSKDNSNIGRGIYDLAGDATQAYEDSRKKAAEFINAGKDEIVFVRNTTEAENLLAFSLDFEGDIILSQMAHHSEQLPWREKADQEGKNVHYLDTSDGRISVEDAEEKISEDTGLIAVSHISNIFGVENPIKELVQIADDNDALLVLDCAQSAPHMELDVEELGADFITFSGHKMLGPAGIGVLYGRKKLLEDMSPYQVGGGMVKSVKKESVRYQDPPHKFEAGTPNTAGAVGLKAAIEYLQNVGLDRIHDHDIRISEGIREGLEEVEGVNVLSPRGSVLVSFYSEEVHSHDLAEVLNQKDVAVRAGHHCAQPQHEELDMAGTVRVSPYLYNTEDEVKELLDAVEEAVKIFNV